MEAKSDQHQQAKSLYSQTDLSQADIAAALGINRKTLYNWIKEGSWFRLRTAIASAPGLLIGQYYNQLFAINDKIANRPDPFPTDKEAGTIKKITATIRQLSGRQSGPEAIDTLARFAEHARQHRPSANNTISALMDSYIAQYFKKQDSLSGRQACVHDEDSFEREYSEWLATQPAAGDSCTEPAEAPDAKMPVAPVADAPVAVMSPGGNDEYSPLASPGAMPRTPQNGVTTAALHTMLEPLPAAVSMADQHLAHPTENYENGVTLPPMYSLEDKPEIIGLLAQYDDPFSPNPPPYTPAGLSSEEYFRVEIEMRNILNAMPDVAPLPPTPMGQLLISPPLTQRSNAA